MASHNRLQGNKGSMNMNGQAFQLLPWIEAQVTSMALVMSRTIVNQCSPKKFTVIRRHVSKFIDDET